MQGPEKDFFNAAIRHGEYIVTGEAREANLAYDDIAKSMKEIRMSQDSGATFLSSLLSETNPSVVKWAAFYLLPYDEPNAVAALSRVADGDFPRISFGARMTLEEWRAGRLAVD